MQLRLVSDLDLSVPHELLQVSVFRRSLLLWTATKLQKNMESRSLQTVVSSIPEMSQRQSQPVRMSA